jgi:hypothetical protein
MNINSALEALLYIVIMFEGQDYTVARHVTIPLSRLFGGQVLTDRY